MRLTRDAKVTYPLVQDTSDNQLFRLFRGTGMPTTVFLTANGSVQQTYSGELSADLLRERLNNLVPSLPTTARELRPIAAEFSAERVCSMAGGRWLSPEKRLVWDQEIGGSNPPRPTNPCRADLLTTPTPRLMY